MVTIIKDVNKYLSLINDLLNDHAIISDPKQLTGLIKLFKRNNQITGWEIDNSEIRFETNDILDCDEIASQNGDRYDIKGFSYHFKATSDNLYTYRIDLVAGDLHLNTDSSFKKTYGDHLGPDQLAIDITGFNCLLAMMLALLYIREKVYPADPKANIYEKALLGFRRKLA